MGVVVGDVSQVLPPASGVYQDDTAAPRQVDGFCPFGGGVAKRPECSGDRKLVVGAGAPQQSLVVARNIRTATQRSSCEPLGPDPQVVRDAVPRPA